MANRFHALDIFRGLTVAAMILVNSPGSWAHIYTPLRHAAWHGLSPTDLVFPFFLFIVGSAYYFSAQSIHAMPFAAKANKIIKRSLSLFAIGLGLNLWAQWGDIEHLRVLGVLQRIALCSLFASFILLLSTALRLSCILLLLASYSAMYIGYESAYSLLDNPVRRVDLWLLGENHMWSGLGVVFDPEGLLSTLPAIVNVLIGYEATRYITHVKPAQRLRQSLLIGSTLVCIGYVIGFVIPINKSLWTASFVIVSSGYALLFLALLIKAYEFKHQTGIKQLLSAAEDFGLNPLFIYVFSWLWVASYYLIDINGVTLQAWLFQPLAILLPSKLASLVFAIIHVIMFWLIARYMRIKNIRISL